MSKYKDEKSQAEHYYKQLKPIFCKALKAEIHFNRLGFQHIIHKKGRHIRESWIQVERFKLLPVAVRLVELTTTYQEYQAELVKMKIEQMGEPVCRNKEVIHWGLIAILDKKKVKVILRKVGNGNIHFWSIIPDWTTSKTRDEKYFSLMKGNPNED
jgi:hypothetical protein